MDDLYEWEIDTNKLNPSLEALTIIASITSSEIIDDKDT